MHGSVFDQPQIAPLAQLNLTHAFWSLNIYTLVYTWIALLILSILIYLARQALDRNNSVGQHLVIQYVQFFRDLVTQSLGEFNFRHCAFIGTLFTFILACNLMALIPGMGEPTSDLMTTFALSITGLCYAQWAGIQAHGVLGHFKNYLQPFALMLPLNIVSHFAEVLSLAFRLFGNIFGGAMITSLWHSALSNSLILQLTTIPITMLILAFFGLFEGLIQAFVFTILSLTYLALETREH